MGSGFGGRPEEQYLAYHPGNLTNISPVVPYETAVLRNVATGLWCRLAPLPSNTSQLGMLCDQNSPTMATNMTYTGDGLSYQGVALVASGPGQPLLLENTTAAPVPGPTADNLLLVPAPVGGCLADWVQTWWLDQCVQLSIVVMPLSAVVAAAAAAAATATIAAAGDMFAMHNWC